MTLKESDYKRQVIHLLPRGPIWKPVEGTLFDGLLGAIASEFARVDNRIDRLLDEADPRTAVETLEQWFTDWGVPSACLAAIADPTREQMRRELLAKITSNSPLSAAYFVELGRILGYDVEVETFEPHTVKSTVDVPIYDDNWVTTFVLSIRVGGDTNFEIKDVTWDVEKPLALWGEALLECIIRAQAPAHTHVIFSYGDRDENRMASKCN